MLALDLEQYDYGKDATSLIRATEGTILERIPPRVRIRSGAALEVPHILVLIDDPERTVIEPLAAADSRQDPAYDFDLMLGSGHLRGQWVDAPDEPARTLAALAALAAPATFARKYDLPAGSPVMLFAMGDGNHSLATAKSIWEQGKAGFGMDHPARYALVEVENIHDRGAEVRGNPPRVVRRGGRPRRDAGRPLRRACPPDPVRFRGGDGATGGRAARPRASRGGRQRRMDLPSSTITAPSSNLPVGTLQNFLDDWGQHGGYRAH